MFCSEKDHTLNIKSALEMEEISMTLIIQISTFIQKLDTNTGLFSSCIAIYKVNNLGIREPEGAKNNVVILKVQMFN